MYGGAGKDQHDEMIVVIRISGLVEVPSDVQETLFRMRLRRKYSAVLINDTPENKKLLQKVRNFVAFGTITKETLHDLIAKRAVSPKKVNAAEVVEQLGKKDLADLGIKPFFRLHPPRGGINSKAHFPIKKGVLGDNKESINALIRRML
ncbi:uL30 family ribosomal protein [Candidatus Pacearchaeota archaeon]|nr:uL30 family ribosomal protein [Candidatus Pacearchaeota archaeon]